MAWLHRNERTNSDFFHDAMRQQGLGAQLLDQLQFMKRCGFDSYVLRADKDIAKAPKCLSFFTQTYQAATDTDQPLFRRRAS